MAPTQTAAPEESSNHRYDAVAQFLKKADRELKLGRAPPDHRHASTISILLTTFPWLTIFLQLIWSVAVTIAAFFLAKNYSFQTDANDKTPEFKWDDTFTVEFWNTRLNVPSSLLSGAGWALFVLLGFYIREASRRYMTAVQSWDVACAHLMVLMRSILQVFRTVHWHPGDIDRIVSHLVAYPIVLKMALRRERDASQLQPILDPSDLRDVLAADSMHAHCLRVVRSYLIAQEADTECGFRPDDHGRTGPGVSYIVFDFLHVILEHSNTLLNIAEFSPAFGYIFHLKVFMFIWLFFLPLNIIQSSGWYVLNISHFSLLDFNIYIYIGCKF